MIEEEIAVALAAAAEVSWPFLKQMALARMADLPQIYSNSQETSLASHLILQKTILLMRFGLALVACTVERELLISSLQDSFTWFSIWNHFINNIANCKAEFFSCFRRAAVQADCPHLASFFKGNSTTGYHDITQLLGVIVKEPIGKTGALGRWVKRFSG